MQNTRLARAGAVSEDVLDFVSEIVADPPINGDMRVALDLLCYAGTLAENMGAERVAPEHIRRVYGETHPATTTQDIIELDMREKLALYALLRLLEGRASLTQPSLRSGMNTSSSAMRVVSHPRSYLFGLSLTV